MRNTTLITDIARLTAAVKVIIDDYAKDGASFSAWNITRELRSKYPTEEIDHLPVRDVVHLQMGGRSDYTKDATAGFINYVFTGAKPQAAPVAATNNGPLALGARPNTFAAAPLTITKGVWHINVIKGRRVCVPMSVVKSAGLTIGDRLVMASLPSCYLRLSLTSVA
jgi:hypothetical protein